LELNGGLMSKFRVLQVAGGLLWFIGVGSFTGAAQTISITPGLLSTVVGTGTAGNTGNGGQASLAKVNQPDAAAFDAAGNLYFADYGNQVVREITPAGILSVFAGKGTASHTGDGGLATAANISAPRDLAIDPQGNVFILEQGYNCVRRVDAVTGIITTYAGVATTTSTPDSGDGGPATSAYLYGPRAIALDAAGNLYIVDYQASTIRKVDAVTHNISRFAGTPNSAGHTGDGGPATSATFNSPYGIRFDAAGNAYVDDFGNAAVRKIDTSGMINLFAGTEGTGGYSGDGGQAKSAMLSGPRGIALDAAGDLYINDTGNFVVRKINTAGVISTIAGKHASGNSGDGGPATAGTFNTLYGVVLDTANNLYLGDQGANVIRKITVGTGLIAFPDRQEYTASTALSVEIANTGILPLTLSGIAFSGTGFAMAPSGGTDCTATTVLASGTTCRVGAKFSPTDPGAYTGTITLTDNTGGASGSQQTIQLTGTSVLKTSGAAVTVTLTSTPASYALVGNAVSLAIKVAPTGTSPNIPTGMVQILNGGNALSAVVLDATGNAILDLGSSLAAGTYNFVAVYPGDANFQSGTATLPFSVQNDFTMALSSASGQVSADGTVTTTVTVTPSGTSPGAFQLGCSSMHVYITCTFSPSTLPQSTSPVMTTLTITSTQVPVTAPADLGLIGALSVSLSLLLTGFRKRISMQLLLALTLLVGLGAVSGCGSSTSQPTTFPVPVTVTVTSGQATHTAVYNVNIY
jgi:sugar lactone lactonase YvrE